MKRLGLLLLLSACGKPLIGSNGGNYFNALYLNAGAGDFTGSNCVTFAGGGTACGTDAGVVTVTPLAIGTGPSLAFLGGTTCVLGAGGDAGACYAPLASSGATTHCAAAGDGLAAAHPGCNVKADAGFVAFNCDAAATGTASAICFN